jgi:uncharacterized membrane protein
MIEKISLLILATLAPISELRGGIPLGIALDLNPVLTFFLAVFFNCLIFFPVYFGMKLFYDKILSKISIFNLYLKKLWKRGKPFVDRYGLIGLAIFVAIPLPLTGAYSGTFLSWLLGLKWKKAFLAVCLGVIIAGIIVLSFSLGLFS